MKFVEREGSYLMLLLLFPCRYTQIMKERLTFDVMRSRQIFKIKEKKKKIVKTCVEVFTLFGGGGGGFEKRVD